MAVVGGCAHHGKGAALARANAAEGFQIFFENGQHERFWRLVAPDLLRAHTVLFKLAHRGSQSSAPRPASLASSGEGVGQAARAHVVDRRMGLAAPSCQQRSMTSAQRRSISGLPRCTESKSRSAVLVPVAMESEQRRRPADEHAGAAELDQQ